METRAPLDAEMLCAQAPWLRALARHLVRDPARAEDIAQETLLAALQSPPADIVDVARLRAWLRRVAYNLSHLSARRNMRRRAREERVATSEVEVSTADLVLLNSIRTQLADAVDALEEPYRRTVELRYFEGASTADIATQMGTTDNAVRKRLFRARRKLRDSLDHAHRGDRLAWFSALAPLTVPTVPSVPPVQTSPVRTGQAGPHAAEASTTVLGPAKLGALAASLALVAGASLAILADRDLVPSLSPERSADVASVPAPAILQEGTARRRPLLPHLPAAGASEAEAPAQDTETGDETTGPEAERVARPEPSTEAPVPVHGRVVDLSGAPVAGLAVACSTGSTGSTRRDGLGDRTTPPVHTDADGRFTASLSPLDLEGGSLLRAEGAGWQTVRAASLDARNAGLPASIVVAREVDVRGTVVLDGSDRPVPAARLRLVAEDHAFLAIDASLAATILASVEDSTDGDGRFHLPQLPSGPGLYLEVQGPGAADDGAEPVRVPVPQHDTSQWTVRLMANERAPLFVSGHVRLEDGSPSIDTLVRLGNRETRTDASGRFGFRLQRFDPDTPLTAEREGFRQRLVPRLRMLLRPDATRHAGDEGSDGAWNANALDGSRTLDLVLVESTATIEGRVVDPDGRPCADWVVHALESGVDEPLLTRASTDAQGRFRLARLTEGPHRLVAHDPETLATVDEDDVEPDGPTVVLAARALDELRNVEGTVIDDRGDPIAGARIAVARVLLDGTSAARAGRRPRHDASLHASTDAVVTDARGAFRLQRLPREGAELVILADGGEHHVRLDEAMIEDASAGWTLSISRAATLRVRTPLVAAVAFELHDAQGQPLPVSTLDRRTRRRVPLFDGQSLTARTGLDPALSDGPTIATAEAHTIVLLDERGDVVGRLPFEDARVPR